METLSFSGFPPILVSVAITSKLSPYPLKLPSPSVSALSVWALFLVLLDQFRLNLPSHTFSRGCLKKELPISMTGTLEVADSSFAPIAKVIRP